MPQFFQNGGFQKLATGTKYLDTSTATETSPILRQPGSDAGLRPEILSASERITAVLLFMTMLFLRILYAFYYHVDSDETQHLHVVWAWANGLVQYRDVFDNHPPLFQMLC